MTIGQDIQTLQQALAQTVSDVHRAPNSVRIIAVSKGQPASAIEQAFAAGLYDFGENYWQEAQIKLNALSHLPLTWHFIGPIQSNKTAAIAQHFAWVHSVDRLKIAQLLAQYRGTDKPPLNICLQINLDHEPSKQGMAIEEIPELVQAIDLMPTLTLRGFMTIPKPQHDEEKQYQSLLRLSDLLQQTNQQLHVKLDTLSMGMSDDWRAAVRAGSTMIRIGRAIFGERLTS